MITRRLIHLHVPKTAGTALKSAFQQHSGGKLRVYPEWDERKFSNVNVKDFDFFSGHFGFATAKRLDGDIFTVLRDPVDRFISVYYFWRQLYARNVERTQNTEFASKFSLADFVTIRDQPSLIEEFQNRSVFQIARGATLQDRRSLRSDGLNEDAIYKLALTNMASFSVVGIQENMPEFIRKMTQTFAVELKLRDVNVTAERPNTSDVPIYVRRLIHDWVYLDIELYQEAVRLITKRSKE